MFGHNVPVYSVSPDLDCYLWKGSVHICHVQYLTKQINIAQNTEGYSDIEVK